MKFFSGRSVAAALLVLGTGFAGAQQPTSAEARALLQQRPDLAAQLRQRMETSGLTPDQIRARLRAEGYPEDLLDAYLPGARVRPDSMRTDSVLAAVRSLGLVDSTDVMFLPRRKLDSLALDTARRSMDERRRRERADSGTTIFGLEMFQQPTTLFDPNVSGPVDPSYRLGPGDRLVLILTGDVEAAHTLDVTREGFVVIPQVGQLYVNNLTLAQLEDLLYARLGRVYSGVRRGPGATTRFSVSVARLRSNQVFVVGDVAQPGSFRISSAGTAMSALYAAGGPTENGTMRRVAIRRGGQIVDSLDVYDYLLRGDASHDVRLQTGDVVFIGPHGPRVRVIGQVLRPAIYEMKPGETLADAIRDAGGFTAEASRRRVQIERILAPRERRTAGQDRVVLDVASPELETGFGPAVPIQDGDVIRVWPVLTQVRNRIRVQGAVWNPGPQAFRPGLRLSEAIRAAGGLRPEAYLGEILVTRRQSDTSLAQLRASFRDTTGVPTEDLPLQEFDEITVFNVAGFRPSRFVAIAGAVRAGGRFTYREGMTLRDLVLMAGGPEEGADLREAEIARLPVDRKNGTTAITIRVPLDSSYLPERSLGGRYLGPPGEPAKASGAPEVVLQPYDNVLILRQQGWELQRSVWVTGEVKYPGRYTLRTREDRLSDVLTRAGGLTRDAYPEGVFFSRSKQRRGRIGIDLPSILKNTRYRDNLVLMDGDSIHIPSYEPVVNVTGAVNAPVTVPYVPGENLWFYVRSAGGPSVRADAKRSYVTQPNGRVESVQRRRFLPDDTPVPRAGASVYVPQRDTLERRDYSQLATTAAQILASLATVVVLLVQALR